jgi:hypothetical protein
VTVPNVERGIGNEQISKFTSNPHVSEATLGKRKYLLPEVSTGGEGTNTPIMMELNIGASQRHDGKVSNRVYFDMQQIQMDTRRE